MKSILLSGKTCQCFKYLSTYSSNLQIFYISYQCLRFVSLSKALQKIIWNSPGLVAKSDKWMGEFLQWAIWYPKCAISLWNSNKSNEPLLADFFCQFCLRGPKLATVNSAWLKYYQHFGYVTFYACIHK